MLQVRWNLKPTSSKDKKVMGATFNPLKDRLKAHRDFDTVATEVVSPISKRQALARELSMELPSQRSTPASPPPSSLSLASPFRTSLAPQSSPAGSTTSHDSDSEPPFAYAELDVAQLASASFPGDPISPASSSADSFVSWPKDSETGALLGDIDRLCDLDYAKVLGDNDDLIDNLVTADALVTS